MNVNRLILFVMGMCLVLSVHVISNPQRCFLIARESPSYHIVVAKYKEDVSWFFHMDQKKLHVYDKSGEKTPFVPLENKGREGATFLWHIVQYYDNLPDYLVLLQGDPFPHMHPGINPRNLQEKIRRLVEKRPTQIVPLFCDYNEENLYTFSGLMMDQYYRLMFEGTPSPTLRFAAGNQYLIPKKDIQKRPKTFYKKLWKMSMKGDHYDTNTAHYEEKTMIPDEMIGWSLERIFPTIVMKEAPLHKPFMNNK